MSWDKIHHKALHRKLVFFPFTFATESYFHFWAHFHRCMHYFCLYELIYDFLWLITQPALIWLPFLLRFSLNAFLHSLKILHMYFISKNVPAKRDETFIWEKNVPPKRDPGFMKVGSLLGGRIYFHINRFWFFNRILL